MKKVAIILWLYRTRRWPLIKQLLDQIKNKISLYVGVCPETCDSELYEELQNYAKDTDGKITYYNNIGKSSSSFLYEISELDAKKHPLFIKIHSQEQITSLRFQFPVLESLLNDLIGNEETFINNGFLFKSNPECGMIANSFFCRVASPKFDDSIVKKFFHFTGADYYSLPNHKKQHVNKSIFMSRTDIFQRHITKDFADSIAEFFTNTQNDEETEKMLLSLEIFFGYIVNFQGLKIIPTEIRKEYKISHSKFHLIPLPNNYVYLKENPFISGVITEQTNKVFTVEWRNIFCKHLQHFSFDPYQDNLLHLS